MGEGLVEEHKYKQEEHKMVTVTYSECIWTKV